MLDENPSQIQSQSDHRSPHPSPHAHLPIILIHDGGGTTFGYFLLGPLYRDVWALHNPHFESGEPFPGGIQEMAKLYVQMIRDAGVRGRVLLGGWSMGGYLSLAITHLLASEPQPKGKEVTIAGLLIIDSPYHHPSIRTQTHANPDIGVLPPKVRACYSQCEEMLKTWNVPDWSAKGLVLPPAVLVRCVKRTPVKDSDEAEGRGAAVDEFRDEQMLGWEGEGRYPKGWIRRVLEVQAHHYDLFELKKADDTTVVVNEALTILDELVDE